MIANRKWEYNTVEVVMSLISVTVFSILQEITFAKGTIILAWSLLKTVGPYTTTNYQQL